MTTQIQKILWMKTEEIEDFISTLKPKAKKEFTFELIHKYKKMEDGLIKVFSQIQKLEGSKTEQNKVTQHQSKISHSNKSGSDLSKFLQSFQSLFSPLKQASRTKSEDLSAKLNESSNQNSFASNSSALISDLEKKSNSLQRQKQAIEENFERISKQKQTLQKQLSEVYEENKELKIKNSFLRKQIEEKGKQSLRQKEQNIQILHQMELKVKSLTEQVKISNRKLKNLSLFLLELKKQKRIQDIVQKKMLQNQLGEMEKEVIEILRIIFDGHKNLTVQKQSDMNSFVQKNPKFFFLNSTILKRQHMVDDDYHFLFREIQSFLKTSRKIKEFKFLFRSSYFLKSEKSPRLYIDGHSYILFVTQLQENGHIIGAFSQSGFEDNQSQPSSKGFLFSLTNKKVFHLKSKSEGYSFTPYSAYHYIFGNGDIRIQIGTNEIASTFGQNASFFKDNQNDLKIHDLFGLGEKRETKMADYEVYQVKF